jgi:hypothetical protein
MRPRLACALVAISLAAAPAAADPRPRPGLATDPKVVHADALFAEGRALLESNLLAACAKFAESLRENPAALGTLLNVAVCDEKLGRIATAVARFTDARDRARGQGLAEHQRVAAEHLAALAPHVPHLAITLTAPAPDTTVVLDDARVALDHLADLAVDPGERTLVVSAPGRLPYRATLTLARDDRRAVRVPRLAASITVTSSRLRIGQIATFAGGAAVLTGLGLGLYARHQYDQEFGDGKPCSHAGDVCTPDGQRAVDHARALGNIGTAIGVVGLVAVGARHHR